MATVARALFAVLLVVTATFYVAGTHGAGAPWARDVCSISHELCGNPGWLMLATAVTGGVFLVLRALKL